MNECSAFTVLCKELFFGKDEKNTKSTASKNRGTNTVNHELSSKK